MAARTAAGMLLVLLTLGAGASPGLAKPPAAATGPTPRLASMAAAPGPLRVGDQGPDVVALQHRLISLGYWLGEADGLFDEDTRHAVVAFQKLNGLARDGAVGPRTQAALDGAQRPTPRTAEGHVVEIDLTHQVLLIVDDGVVSEIVDVSTGRRRGTTPVGDWTVYREIDGLRRAPLGLLYRPKYVRGGVAIHGYTSVPPQPASHGCVRVTYTAMDHLWGGAMPLGTRVKVYR